MIIDPRTLLARPDLAAVDLEGLAPAARYASARPHLTITPMAANHRLPDPASERVNHLLFGEVFDVIDTIGDFAWGRARRDGYVGYVLSASFSRDLHCPTHRISALRTYAFAEPSIKSPPWGPVSLNALITVDAVAGALVHAVGAGWIAAAHVMPIGQSEADWVSVAERFLSAPYLWGGRDSLGLDCSGLVQQALFAACRACPRDADQQQKLGRDVEAETKVRGDLVFWRGHVGIMFDRDRLLHANAHHMAVAIEPLAEATQRIAAKGGGEPVAWRRL